MCGVANKMSREIRRQEERNKSFVRQMFRDVFEREELDEQAVARYFSPRYVQKVERRWTSLASLIT